MKNSRVQEPNVETDHLESSTSGSVNLLNQSFDTRFQPTRQDVCWSRGHALLHQVVQNQPDGQVCSCKRTKGRHMCPVPAMEAYRECCHCSTHSSPLFHFKDGRTLTSKSFRSTFLPLVWWSYVYEPPSDQKLLFEIISFRFSMLFVDYQYEARKLHVFAILCQ